MLTQNNGMTRTVIAPLFVAILLVVSGCNALDIGTTTDTLSVTPAPVPTKEPVPQVTPQPPCLPNSPIGNVSALVAAHNATLRNTSFTVRETHTEIYQNGTLRFHSVVTTHIAEEYSRIHIIEKWINPRYPQHSSNLRFTRHGREGIWTDGDHGMWRTISGHTVRYSPFNPNGPIFLWDVYHSTNEPAYILCDSTVSVIDRFSRNERTIYLVEFTTSIDTGPNVTILRNATGRAFVDSRGVVHEIRMKYPKKTVDGTVVTVTERIYITNIGSTTVERPVWYGIAINRTQTQNQTNVASDTARDQGSRTE
jgi:hypothetical protein